MYKKLLSFHQMMEKKKMFKKRVKIIHLEMKTLKKYIEMNESNLHLSIFLCGYMEKGFKTSLKVNFYLNCFVCRFFFIHLETWPCHSIFKELFRFTYFESIEACGKMELGQL